MESLAADLRVMTRTPLHDSHVDALRDAGTERAFAQGDLVVEIGAPIEEFIYVLEGEIELVNPFTGERLLPHGLGPTQFLGEISFLRGGIYTLSMRAAEPTRVLVVPRARMLELMSAIPEMSDIILTVFAARRRRLLEVNEAALTLIGAERDRDIRRIASFVSGLRRNRLAKRKTCGALTRGSQRLGAMCFSFSRANASAYSSASTP